MTFSKRDEVIRVLRKIQLEALIELDRICQKHSIPYFLSGGSCLGAIRHHGFIPWDDDIDVDMDRADFERLREVAKEELDHDRFFIQCMEDDPDYHSYTPRLMVKNTVLNNKSSEVQGIVNCICVDIMLNDYVPNDPVMRKDFMDRMYLTKVLTYFKWYRQSAFLTTEEKKKYKEYVETHDYDFFVKENDKYAKYYFNRGEKTDYFISTAIINGNMEAFPSRLKKEYIDVQFEGHTFKTLACYDEYLQMLYGKNYMDIFPPEKRVSHHRLKRVDFGPYAEKYGMNPEYVKYLMMYLDSDRARQVKKVSLEMLDMIDSICQKHDITYYFVGKDMLYRANGTEEYASLWRDDTTILMDMENLEKFEEVCKDELSHFYFLETAENTEEYHFPYAKLKLNYTYFRDRRTSPAAVHPGLWVNIGLLIKTSSFRRQREKHFEQLSLVYDQIRMKWLYSRQRAENAFADDEERMARWEAVQDITLEELLEKQNALINKYEKKKAKYYLEATTSLLGLSEIPAKLFGKVKRLSYNGHEYVFPDDIESLMNLYMEDNPAIKKHLLTVRKLKNKNRERYDYLCRNLTEKQFEKLNQKVNLFDLGMYDAPDYRSGVFDMDIKAADQE